MHSFRIKAVAKKYLRRAYFEDSLFGFDVDYIILPVQS